MTGAVADAFKDKRRADIDREARSDARDAAREERADARHAEHERRRQDFELEHLTTAYDALAAAFDAAFLCLKARVRSLGSDDTTWLTSDEYLTGREAELAAVRARRLILDDRLRALVHTAENLMHLIRMPAVRWPHDEERLPTAADEWWIFWARVRDAGDEASAEIAERIREIVKGA